MTKKSLIVLSLLITILSCTREENTNETNNYLIIKNSSAVDCVPNIKAKPTFDAVVKSFKDSIIVIDFLKDHNWDIELITIKSKINGLYNGVAIRSIPNNDKTTYVCLKPLNSTDTIKKEMHWNLVRSTELIQLMSDTTTINQWSDFKYLAVRQYYQNEDINKYYWIKLKVNQLTSEIEIDSYSK